MKIKEFTLKEDEALFIGLFLLILVIVLILNIITNPKSILFFVIGLIPLTMVTSQKKNNQFKTLSILLLLLIISFILSLYLDKNLEYIIEAKSSTSHLINFIKQMRFNFLQNNFIWFSLGLMVSILNFRKNNYLSKETNHKIKFKNIFNKKKPNKPTDILIGKDTETNEDIYLTEENLDHHTQIIGATGSGKTNLIKNIIESRIKSDQGMIFIDCKGDQDLINWCKKLLNKHQRDKDFNLLSITNVDESIYYNPIEYGSASEISSRIMSSIRWSEEFYKKYSQISLYHVCSYLKKVENEAGIKVSLEDIKNFLKNKNYFLTLENNFALLNEDECEELEKIIYSKEGRQNLTGLIADLENVCSLDINKKLKSGSSKSIIDIAKNNGFIYIQLNTMVNSGAADIIGRLLLQDIIYHVGTEFLTSNPYINSCLMIDEFEPFASQEFVGLINRARGAKLPIIIAHQASGDLRKISENFENTIATNTGNKIIFGTILHEEAEKFARYVGTKKSYKETQVFEEKDQLFKEKTLGNRGSVREVEEFAIHPNQIKKLPRGQILLIKRLVDEYSGIVQINQATKF